MMRSHGFWLALLVTMTIVAPYAFGVRPKARRDWTCIAATIAFLSWVLLMVPLYSW